MPDNNQNKQLTDYLQKIGVFCAFSNTPIDRTKPEVKKEVSFSESRLEQKVIQKVSHQENADDLFAQISACKTLEELHNLVLNFEGCELKETATNTVFCDGVNDADIMVVGEAPGAEEDALGKPFVGKSGQLVDKMFETIGLSRKTNLYITNMVFWRPPGNRLPTQKELDLCFPFLKKHIELFNPKVILTLGGVSAKMLLNTSIGVTKLRGEIKNFHHDGLKRDIPLLCFYHPAYLLRSPKQKRTFWQDLLLLDDYIKNNRL